MKCPYCTADNSRVLDSRPVDDNAAIRRRRLCDTCGKRFTTYEKVETLPMVVIKKDQTREQYDRMKLQGGLMRACYKRAIPVEKIEALIDAVETEIYRTSEHEIHSSQIGELVMKQLEQLDAVAYVRFASVYREFKDADTFMAELRELIGRSEK